MGSKWSCWSCLSLLISRFPMGGLPRVLPQREVCPPVWHWTMGRKRSLGHLDVGSNCGRRVFLDAPMLDVFPYGYRADSTRAGLYQKRFSKCNGTGVFPQRGSNCKNFSGWWFGTFIYLGTIIPTDALIFFRGVGQPPTSFSVCVFPRDIEVIPMAMTQKGCLFVAKIFTMSCIMWLKVKTLSFLPPMTGNGKHTTYKFMVVTGGW